VPANALLAALEAAPSGTWLRVNTNQFQDVWTPVAQRPAHRLHEPGEDHPRVEFVWIRTVTSSCSGGGRANFSGNEVYRFDVRSGLWRRASLPSSVWNPLGDGQYFAVDSRRTGVIARMTRNSCPRSIGSSFGGAVQRQASSCSRTA
jgi:hypothetical protein